MSKTRANSRRSLRAKSVKRKTRNMRLGSITNVEKSHIIRLFLEMLNVVKLYHWKTRSYSQHKATDELYGKLNDHIDTFVEVLLGKDQSRIQMVEKDIKLMDYSDTRDFQSKVLEYRSFLTDMNIYFDASRDTDLLNIRDEILGDINQFLYLMTFDK